MDFNILRVSFPKCPIKPKLSEKSVPSELWTVCSVEEQNPISKSLCSTGMSSLWRTESLKGHLGRLGHWEAAGIWFGLRSFWKVDERGDECEWSGEGDPNKLPGRTNSLERCFINQFLLRAPAPLLQIVFTKTGAALPARSPSPWWSPTSIPNGLLQILKKFTKHDCVLSYSDHSLQNFLGTNIYSLVF